MIPPNFVITVNKSYVHIVKNKNSLDVDKVSPPTIVRFSINPVIILGGGINNVTAPSFLIDVARMFSHIKRCDPVIFILTLPLLS